jgi:hypothetical protein
LGTYQHPIVHASIAKVEIDGTLDKLPTEEAVNLIAGVGLCITIPFLFIPIPVGNNPFIVTPALLDKK